MMQSQRGICWPKGTPTTHGSMKYQLLVELHQLRQEPGQSINGYYDQLHFIWDQIDLFDPT